MEEIEVPTEHLHEAVHHEAHHSQEAWITWVALSTALLAALAAVTALLSGMNANEALIDRVTASDSWNEYQANGIKYNDLQATTDQSKLKNEKVPDWFAPKIKKYAGEKERLSKKATAEEEAFHQRLERHEILAHGVTMFQIAISIAAIAALTKRRWFWYMGLGFGAVGVGFLVYALTFMHVTELSEEKTEQKEPKEKTKDSKGSPEAKPAKSESEGVIFRDLHQFDGIARDGSSQWPESLSSAAGAHSPTPSPSPLVPFPSPLFKHVNQHRVA